MFRRKNDKRIVELNPEELRLAKYALLGFRNKLVAQGLFQSSSVISVRVQRKFVVKNVA